MIEPRVYRAAFVPALLVLVLTMFSFEDRPRALSQRFAADVLFEGRLVADGLRDLVARTPDRRPGTLGDEAAGHGVRRAFRSQGFETTMTRFEEEGRELANVVGRRPGVSRREIVVMAGRDAISVPDATGSAADTAALIEVARVFQGRALRKTLVLASVDGSTLGGSGARRFADDLEEPGLIDAVIVVSGSAAPRSRGPLIVAWSNDSSRGNIGLERTAAGGLRAELESLPRQEGVFGQLARLAFPIGLGDQGVLLERGLDAVRISGSGELAPPEDARGVDDVDVERYGDFGRGLLQTVFAIEAGDHPRHGPETYLTIAGKTLPGWAISLLAITLLLPALVASVDALARTRRRRHPVRPFVHWLASAVLPFAIGLALAELLVLAGLAEDAPPAPLDPTARPFDGAAAATLAAVTLTIALAWVLGRSPVLRGSAPLPDAGEPGAGCVVALALSVAGLAVWVVNPFAALVLVPAVHLVAIVALTELRTRASAAMLAVALLPPLAILAYYLHRFSLDPLEGAWYLFLLVTGHHAGLATALTGCLLLGTLGCAAAIVLARRRSQRAVDERRDAEDRERPRVLGPGGHAGPGALGGTESTLRR